jgi:hypothetical protein
MKHDASAKSFLEKTPAENGVPHFMGMTFRPAQAMTQTIQEILPQNRYLRLHRRYGAIFVSPLSKRAKAC